MTGKTNAQVSGLTPDDEIKLATYSVQDWQDIRLMYGSEYQGQDIKIIVPDATTYLSGNLLRYSTATSFGIITIKNEGKKITSLNTPFNYRSCSKIVFDIDTSQILSWLGAFRYSQVDRTLTEISGELDFTSATNVNYIFGSRFGLTTVRFKPETLSISMGLNDCAALDEDSLASIINGLADLTGQTGQTLTLHSTAKAKLTQEQIATITAKNWTLA